MQIYLIILMMNLFTIFVGSFLFLLNYEYENINKHPTNQSIHYAESIILFNKLNKVDLMIFVNF